LSTVLDRHLPALKIDEKRKMKLRKVASASFSVNTALATAVRGGSANWPNLALELLALGPLGWHRYLRDSRIVERVSSRLKLRHAAKNSPRVTARA
jgi:hypothetical protein